MRVGPGRTGAWNGKEPPKRLDRSEPPVDSVTGRPGSASLSNATKPTAHSRSDGVRVNPGNVNGDLRRKALRDTWTLNLGTRILRWTLLSPGRHGPSKE